MAMKAEVEDSWLWHKRFGHFNLHALRILSQKNMMRDLPSIKDTGDVCEGCQLGKQHRQAFPSGKAWRAKEFLELVHTDVCGPMRTPSLDKSRYFILFIDDYSRMTWVYFLHEKSEVFKTFQKFKNHVEKQSGRNIKVLRSDRGKEYTSKEFNKFCEEEGVEHQLTVGYAPEQNGVSERKNRTVMEMARSMLYENGLPKTFWAEAVYTAVYLLNRCPTKALQDKTPIEAWSNQKPSAKHLKVFGCICYVHIPAVKRHKLEEKSEVGIFVGYCSQSKGYRIYNPKTKKVIISRDVKFDESAFWNWDEEKVEKKSIVLSDKEVITPLHQSREEADEEATSDPPGTLSTTLPSIQEDSSSDSPPRRTRSLRDIYERCNFMTSKPKNLEVAIKKKAGGTLWKKEKKFQQVRKARQRMSSPRHFEDRDLNYYEIARSVTNVH
jgi:transposase InsO family protein